MSKTIEEEMNDWYNQRPAGIDGKLYSVQDLTITEWDAGAMKMSDELKAACNAITEPWNDAVAAMKHTRNNLTALIEQSDGLAGYHLNGEIAKWDYFEEDDWLGLEQMNRAIALMESHSHSRDEAMVEDKRYERDDIYKK